MESGDGTDEAAQDQAIRLALDALAAENGRGLVDLYDVFGPKLRTLFFKSRLRYQMEIEDFVLELILKLGPEWGKNREPVRNAKAWCTHVLKMRWLDLLRKQARDPIGGLRPGGEADPEAGLGAAELGENSGWEHASSSAEAEAIQNEACIRVLSLTERLPDDIRRVLYLTYVRGFTLPEASQLIFELDFVRLDLESELAVRVAGMEEYLWARNLGLSERESLYFAMDPHERQKLRDAMPPVERDAARVIKDRTKAQNLCRSARYRVHHLQADILPRHPPELRRIWKECWPDESQSLTGFREAAERLGFSETKARSWWEQLTNHVLVLVAWEKPSRGRKK